MNDGQKACSTGHSISNMDKCYTGFYFQILIDFETVSHCVAVAGLLLTEIHLLRLLSDGIKGVLHNIQFYITFLTIHLRFWSDSSAVRVHAALAEDKSSVPVTHIRVLTRVTPAPGHHMPSAFKMTGTHVHTHHHLYIN